jgi:hypothetical protein
MTLFEQRPSRRRLGPRRRLARAAAAVAGTLAAALTLTACVGQS